jgi:MFS family permease
MVILIGMGERMAERFLPVYLIALGASSLIPGFLNALTNLLSALYSFPGGWLSTRLGYKRALAVFNLVALTGYAIVILVPSWPAVIVGSVFFLAWNALSLPATMDLISQVLPKNKRTMGVSVHSVVRRIPMALGPICGGLLIAEYGIETGVRIAFGAAAFFGVLALVAQQRLIQNERTMSVTKMPGFFTIFRKMPRALKNLLVSDALVHSCGHLPYAYIALWALMPDASLQLASAQQAIPLSFPFIGSVVTGGVDAFQFGMLTAIEMITALLIYIPVAWLADRSHKKPFVVITFINFTLFPLVFWFARGFEIFVLAFILRGLKEFGEATRKALILDLAPEGQKAASFGAYYLVRDIFVSISAVAGAFIWRANPDMVFFAAAILGALGTLYFIFFGSDTSHTAESAGQ